MIDIRHASALELLYGLDAETVDLTVTSPPYDYMRSYKNSDWNMDVFKTVAVQLHRVTKQGGVVVWNVGDQTLDGGESGTSFRQVLYFMDACGFKLHDTMIWQKSNFSNPSSTRYHQVFDYVFVLSKGKPKTFNPIKDRPNLMAGKIGSFGKNTVTQVDGTKVERKRKINTEFGMRHNVWLMNTAGQTGESKTHGHPAMFTVQFAADHIRSWSNSGDLVLDPFLGSGTTAVAAQLLARKFVGGDISEEYCAIARSRIAGQ